MSTKQFEAWWTEQEGFGLRCERFDASRDEALAIWRVAYSQALEDAAKVIYDGPDHYRTGDCSEVILQMKDKADAETGTEK